MDSTSPLPPTPAEASVPIGRDRVASGLLVLRTLLALIALSSVQVLAFYPWLIAGLHPAMWLVIRSTATLLGQLVSVALLIELPVWLATKARNLAIFGIAAPTPQEVLRSFVRPGTNLVRPHRLAQRIWSESDPSRRGGTSFEITVAWVAWLATGSLWICGRALIWLQVDPTIVAGAQAPLWVLQQLFGLMAARATYKAMQEIEARQRETWFAIGITVDEPPPASRELGPRHGVLTVLLGVGGSHLVALAAMMLTPSLATSLVVGQACLALSAVVILRHPQGASLGAGLLRRPAEDTRRWLVASVLIGSGLGVALLGLVMHPLSEYRQGFENPGPLGRGPEGWILLLSWLLIVCGAPVIEELLFRGLVLPTFRLRLDPAPAVLATAVLFSFIHQAPLQMVAVFFVGALCGVVQIASRSVWPSVAMHSAYNLIVVSGLRGTDDDPISFWSLPLGLLVTLIGVALAPIWRSPRRARLLDSGWWWGSERIDAMRDAARRLGQATAPATASLRSTALASVAAAQSAGSRSAHTAAAGVRTTGRGLRTAGALLRRSAASHPARLALAALGASAAFHVYWLFFRLGDLWPGPGGPWDRGLLALDLARSATSMLALAAFVAWLGSVVVRDRSGGALATELDDETDGGRPVAVARRLLVAPHRLLARVWAAALERRTASRVAGVAGPVDARMAPLFWTLTAANGLLLAAAILDLGALPLLAVFRGFLGPILALLLIRRAVGYVRGVESAFR